MKTLTSKQKEKLKEIIANQLQCDEDEITANSHVMHDLGADSLDTVELIMEIEEYFEIQIDDNEAEKATTYEKIEQLVEKKLNESAKPTSNEPVA